MSARRKKPAGRGATGGRRRRAVTERSAGGVVVRRDGDELLVLLIRDPYDKWGLPKGHIEKRETPARAALREVEEETGLDDLHLGPELGSIDWYFRFQDRLIHKYCDYFLMVSPTGEPSPRLEEGISECRWVPLDRVEQEVAYDNAREMVREAVRLLREGEADALLARAYGDPEPEVECDHA